MCKSGKPTLRWFLAEKIVSSLIIILNYDITMQGGNDHEIFSSPKTIGHTVTSPADTIEQCTKLFL